MSEKMKLSSLPETLLITVWAKAVETARPDAIIHDERAVQIVEQIDYDFSKFKKAKMSQYGVAVRSMLLDRATQTFLDTHKKTCVINLGVGLDTRRSRLQNSSDTLWYDLDLPETIDLRRQFFTEDEHSRFLPYSVFDEEWLKRVEIEGRSVLLIAEGIFMYFEEQELKPLLGRLAERFPGGEMLVEVQGPGIVGKAKKHDALKNMKKPPEFKWGIADSRELAHWHRGIDFVEEWDFLDYHRSRAGIFGWLMRIPFLHRKYAPRIVHLRFSAPPPQGNNDE